MSKLSPALQTTSSEGGCPCHLGSLDAQTCATLLVAMNVHPWVAMAILRHSQIAVTMDIYSQVSPESTRQALLRLGSALGDNPK